MKNRAHLHALPRVRNRVNFRPLKWGTGLTELRYTGRLHDRRLLLPFSKARCFGTVSVNAPKPLAIGIKYCHQKVTMLTPLIGAVVGYFSFGLRFWFRRCRCCFFCLFHSHSL